MARPKKTETLTRQEELNSKLPLAIIEVANAIIEGFDSLVKVIDAHKEVMITNNPSIPNNSNVEGVSDEEGGNGLSLPSLPSVCSSCGHSLEDHIPLKANGCFVSGCSCKGWKE